MTDPRPTPRALPWVELSWPRRALMLAAVGAASAGWGYESIRGGSFDPIPLVVLVPLLVTALAANLDRVWVQITVRGVWWFNLGLCTLAMLSSHERWFAVVAVGAGGALLAAGGAGLGEGAGAQGFAPVAFRRPLLASLVMSVAEVQTFASGAFVTCVENANRPATSDPTLALKLAAVALLLLTAVIGLYRLRVWGVLVHLVATGLVTYFACMALHASSVEIAPAVWLMAAVVQLLVPLPMLWAVIGRRPVKVSPPSSLAPRLFSVLVIVMMVAACAGRAALDVFVRP